MLESAATPGASAPALVGSGTKGAFVLVARGSAVTAVTAFAFWGVLFTAIIKRTVMTTTAASAKSQSLVGAVAMYSVPLVFYLLLSFLFCFPGDRPPFARRSGFSGP
jgi:hypothetical protein